MFFLWYRGLLNQVFERYAVTTDEKARIGVLQQEMAKSAGIATDVGQNRKIRICILFLEFDKRTALIDLNRGMLNLTKEKYAFFLIDILLLHIFPLNGVCVNDKLFSFM